MTVERLVYLHDDKQPAILAMDLDNVSNDASLRRADSINGGSGLLEFDEFDLLLGQ